MGNHLVLPVLHMDEESIQKVRDDYAKGLETVSNLLVLDSSARIIEAVDAISSTTNFCLHYQGRNDLNSLEVLRPTLRTDYGYRISGLHAAHGKAQA